MLQKKELANLADLNSVGEIMAKIVGIESALEYVFVGRVRVKIELMMSQEFIFAKLEGLDLEVEYERKTKEYCLVRQTCVPGVHTLSNGDPGYPDDWEDVELVSTNDFPSVVKAIIQSAALMRLECYWEKKEDELIDEVMEDPNETPVNP